MQFSLRVLLRHPRSWLIVLLAPALVTVMVAEAVTDWYYRVPRPAPEQLCMAPPAPRDATAKPTEDSNAPARTTEAPSNSKGNAARCATILGNESAPEIVRARGLTVISYMAASLLGITLVVYALFSIGDFSPDWPLCTWGMLAASILGAIAMATATVHSNWLPHAALVDLFDLLGTRSDKGEANAIARSGSWQEIFVAVLYVCALGAVTTTSRDESVRDLAERFERLTTLSTIGSLTFAVGVVTLSELLSWPLAVPGLGTHFADTETPIIALFSLYLTAILASAYFPAAAILTARAEALADIFNVGDGDRQEWLTKRGLTVMTSARLTASIATLLPLIAGAVTSGVSASSALGGLLK